MDLIKKKWFSLQRRELFRFVGWFNLANTIAFIILGYPYLKGILYSVSLYKATTLKFVFLKTCFIWLFALINYITFMWILALLPLIFVFLLIVFIPNKILIWITTVVISVLNITFLIGDRQLYATSEFHLNSTILDYVFSKNMMTFFDLSNAELKHIIYLLIFLILSEITLAYVVWKKVVRQHYFILIEKDIFKVLIAGFLFCYLSLLASTFKGSALLSHQSEDLPYYADFYGLIVPTNKTPYNNAFDIGQNVFVGIDAKHPMHYPLHPMQCKKPKIPYNIILIVVDTLRFDMLNERFMPKTWAFAEKSWNFLNHNSGGNGTFSGLSSLFYSIPGTYFFSLMSENVKPILYDLLEKNNYKIKIIWSASMQGYEAMQQGVSLYSVEESQSSTDIGYRDRVVTQKANEFLNKNKDGKTPFFMFLLYDAVHGFCREQSIPQIYGQTNEKECSRLVLDNNTDSRPYYNRYLNSVRFDDGEISKILDVIEKDGYINNSIIIITADHGQQFNETKLNAWWHGTNFTHYQIKVPFLIHWPNSAPQKFHYATSSYDLIPTLFEELFACTNPPSDYSIGQNLLKQYGRLPFDLIAGYFNVGIVEKDKIISMTYLGRNIQTKTTDKEGHPLANSEADEPVIKQALQLFFKKYWLPYK